MQGIRLSNLMRNTILNLTEKVAQLTVKVEFLQKENSELMAAMNQRYGKTL